MPFTEPPPGKPQAQTLLATMRATASELEQLAGHDPLVLAELELLKFTLTRLEHHAAAADPTQKE